MDSGNFIIRFVYLYHMCRIPPPAQRSCRSAARPTKGRGWGAKAVPEWSGVPDFRETARKKGTGMQATRWSSPRVESNLTGVFLPGAKGGFTVVVREGSRYDFTP